MDDKYIKDIYDNLGGESVFGNYNDYYSLITSDDSYIKDVYDSKGESVFGSYDDFVSLVKKKDESQPTSQEGVTVSTTKEKTTPTSLESSESKFDYESFIDKDEEEAISQNDEETIIDDNRGQLVKDIDAGKFDDKIETLSNDNEAVRNQDKEQLDNLLSRYNSTEYQLTDEEINEAKQTIENENNGDFGYVDKFKKGIASTSIFRPFINYTSPKEDVIKEIRKEVSKERNVNPKDITDEELNILYTKKRTKE
jgi:hypothetical protein